MEKRRTSPGYIAFLEDSKEKLSTSIEKMDEKLDELAKHEKLIEIKKTMNRLLDDRQKIKAT